jgi:hypothetical protein
MAVSMRHRSRSYGDGGGSSPGKKGPAIVNLMSIRRYSLGLPSSTFALEAMYLSCLWFRGLNLCLLLHQLSVCISNV